MSFDSPSAPAMPALPQAPDKPPMFGSVQAGQKPKAKSQQPTFLGGDASPSANQLGQKSLLGGGAT